MAAREFDPFRLDVTAFAVAGGQLDGEWPLVQFDRLVESAVVGAPIPGSGLVTWQARGEQRKLRGGDAQVWLHLGAAAELPLECQRCLQPVDVALKVERSFLFVSGEDAAAQLDAQSEDDVLALTRSLDLRELVEDELLLALPIVPRHAECAVPLQVDDDGLPVEDAPNPFAPLAALKRPGPLN